MPGPGAARRRIDGSPDLAQQLDRQTHLVTGRQPGVLVAAMAQRQLEDAAALAGAAADQ